MRICCGRHLEVQYGAELLYLQNFFVVKPAKQACVAFSAWITSFAHNGYHALIHAAMIMRADHADVKSEGTITHLHI